MFCSSILLAYDGSESSKRALEKAVELARTNDSIQINVVHAVSTPTAPGTLYKGIPDALREIDLQHGHLIVQQALDLLKESGINYAAFVVEGLPAQELLRFEKDHACDLIIIGCRGLSGLKELFLGSVSHYITQHCRVPILIVK